VTAACGEPWLAFAPAGGGTGSSASGCWQRGLAALQVPPLNLVHGAAGTVVALRGLFLDARVLVTVWRRTGRQLAACLGWQQQQQSGSMATFTCIFHSASRTNTFLTHLLL